MDEISARLDRIFDDVLPCADIPVRERDRSNCVAWTSLANLNLLLSIEEEFDIIIPDEAVVDLDSYATALHVIQVRAAVRLGIVSDQE